MSYPHSFKQLVRFVLQLQDLVHLISRCFLKIFEHDISEKLIKTFSFIIVRGFMNS